MDQKKLSTYLNQFWDENILPTLMEYIKIPNQSPQFDPNWQANGFMDQAVNLLTAWCKKHAIPGMKLDVIRLKNRTPVIFIEIPGVSDETILLYGHLDKQPEMTGWDANLSPWSPVLRDEKLYGRGAADDGYAIFASLAAIKSLQAQQIPHARCLILIEACEESGSLDLPYYIAALADRIRNPSLVICLDSGCGNYDQLWITTSLRGLIGGTLSIQVLKQGIHSGLGSGVVPSSFRILRELLQRIENEKTGEILIDELHVNIPQDRLKQIKETGVVLETSFMTELPLIPGLQLEAKNLNKLLLRRTWEPALSVIGLDGVPALAAAGNVTLPALSVKLSLRLPPTCAANEAALLLKKILEKDPPYRSAVNFEIQEQGDGWNAPKAADWFSEAAQLASQQYFGKNVQYIGEGGSIAFMGMLGKKFPQAQFLITGLLGPGANAHGPNEFLHIPTGKKLTACVAEIIARHFKQM